MKLLKTIFTLTSLAMCSLGPVQASLVEEAAKPLVRLTADAQEKITHEFEEFQTLQNQRRENIFTYRALYHYAEQLGIGPDFSMLQTWVINTHSPEIMLPLATIAQLLSTRTAIDITEANLQEYIDDSREASERAFLLGFIAHNKHKLQRDPLNAAANHPNFADFSPFLETYDNCYITSNYIYETNMITAPGAITPPLAPRDMEIFNELLAVKLGYEDPNDLDAKITILLEENNEKIQRFLQSYDFQLFTNKGHGPSTSTAMSNIHYQMLDHTTAPFMGEMQIAGEILPQDMDIATALTTYTLDSLQGFGTLHPSNIVPHGQFLSCGQGDTSILEEIPPILDVHFQDGVIMRDNAPLTTTANPAGGAIAPLPTGDHTEIWALDLDGNLRINSRDISCELVTNHHYLFSGVDVACAGHISIKDGKVTYIDNASGHYMPSHLNLLFAIKYFHDLELFAEGATANDQSGSSQGALTEMRRFAQLIEVIPGEEG